MNIMMMPSVPTKLVSSASPLQGQNLSESDKFNHCVFRDIVFPKDTKSRNSGVIGNLHGS